MEDFGYKYIYKLTRFLKTQKSRKCLIDLIPKNIENSDFVSTPYSKALQEYGNPKFKMGNRVRISKWDLFLGSYRSHNLRRKFLILSENFLEDLQYTQ